MDNTLAYIDQGSFLALRALGRGPLIQCTWVYDRALDIDGVRRFHANLGFGLLGRRIERSPLPFGRDRWVAHPGPANLDIAAQDRPRAEVWEWADERAQVPTDPQDGPSWHLGVQPLIGGGAAVTLVVSHSIGDAEAITVAIVDAVHGARRDLGYPPLGSRTRRHAVLQDARQTVRSVPEMAKAVVSAVRVARTQGDGLSASVKSGSKQRTRGRVRQAVVPHAVAFIDAEHWDARAESLAGTSNSLFAAVASRLGHTLGRVDDDGRVRLSILVSERLPGDTRANALTAATVTVDPATVTTHLKDIRADVKRALSALGETPNELLGPLPLVPLTPAVLVRRLEGMVQQVGNPIGCSNVGELDPAINRPDGRDADCVALRMTEPYITTTVLDRMGGMLFVGSGRMRDNLFITVSGWVVGGTNTKAALRDSLRSALVDMQLSGTVE